MSKKFQHPDRDLATGLCWGLMVGFFGGVLLGWLFTAIAYENRIQLTQQQNNAQEVLNNANDF